MKQAKKHEEEPAVTWRKSSLRENFESICIAVIFALFIRTFVVQAFKIPSASMEDNLLVGDHILVNKFAYAPRPAWLGAVLPYQPVAHEDVFVFKYPKDPNKDYIKRVIGVGGDRMEIRAGRVLRDGEPLEEPYMFVKPPFRGMSPEQVEERLRREAIPEFRVPARHYVAMGDNRLNSEDSRYWGFVPEALVRGKAMLIYWSFDVPPECRPVEADGDAAPSERGKCLLYTALHFFDRTRWSRSFRLIR